jgi:hypothetical protein
MQRTLGAVLHQQLLSLCLIPGGFPINWAERIKVFTRRAIRCVRSGMAANSTAAAHPAMIA